MEVRAGYKQTEVGVIPEDWDYSLLDENSKRGSGHTPKKQIKEYYDGDIVWVSLADSNKLDKGLINSSSITISKKGIANSSAVLHPKGVVIMSRDAGIGKSAIAECDLCVSQHFITWLCNESTLHNWYLYYWLQYKKTEFERIAIGSTIKTIGLPYFKRYRLALPEYKEQNTIAIALSDVDALISSLEKFIAKKRNIKQGSMQKLLQPKEGWEVKKLGDIGYCFAGGTPSTFNSNYWNGNIIWLPSGRVQNNILQKQDNEITITKLGLEESSSRLIKEYSVLIAITGATCGNIGLLNFSAAANQSVIAIEPNEKAEYRYLYYSLLMKRNEILSNQTGSAQGGVNLKAIKNLEVSFPIPEEQTCIAIILSDIDAEITALETKLEKYKNVKLGMMQALLTGKIRLV